MLFKSCQLWVGGVCVCTWVCALHVCLSLWGPISFSPSEDSPHLRTAKCCWGARLEAGIHRVWAFSWGGRMISPSTRFIFQTKKCISFFMHVSGELLVGGEKKQRLWKVWLWFWSSEATERSGNLRIKCYFSAGDHGCRDFSCNNDSNSALLLIGLYKLPHIISTINGPKKSTLNAHLPPPPLYLSTKNTHSKTPTKQTHKLQSVKYLPGAEVWQ